MSLIKIAKIVSTHGLKGNVKVLFYSDDPTKVLEYKQLIDKQESVYEVEHFCLNKKNILIIKFKGFNSINEAQHLVNKDIYVDKKNIFSNVKDGEFLYDDLCNVPVYIEKKESVFGTVMNLHNFGSCDILEIKKLKDQSSIMVPFIEEYIVSVTKNDIIVSDITERL